MQTDHHLFLYTSFTILEENQAMYDFMYELIILSSLSTRKNRTHSIHTKNWHH